MFFWQLGSLTVDGFLHICGSLEFNGFLFLLGSLKSSGFLQRGGSLLENGFLRALGSLRDHGFLSTADLNFPTPLRRRDNVSVTKHALDIWRCDGQSGQRAPDDPIITKQLFDERP